jgi:hypothetical protein
MMKHRKLRIAWSVAWGIAAMLLVALWVRSYAWIDAFSFPITASKDIGAGSAFGHVAILLDRPGNNPRFDTVHVPVEKLKAGFLESIPKSFWGGVSTDGSTTAIWIRSWLPLLATAILGGTPWLPWWPKRFTLRTLLVATTLVAIGLGLIVWLAR